MFHEDRNSLQEKTKDNKRAVDSLREELEAIDWYQQRIDATTDPSLKAVLTHNLEEEWEHAAMILEWLRRNNEVADKFLKEFLWSEGEIAHEEE